MEASHAPAILSTEILPPPSCSLFPLPVCENNWYLLSQFQCLFFQENLQSLLSTPFPHLPSVLLEVPRATSQSSSQNLISAS